jgi:hypothetical protein
MLFVLISLNDVHFVLIWNPHFFQAIRVLSIASLATPPFQKFCSNRRVVNIIISLTNDVHYNVYHSKPKDVKSRFLCATIPTNKKICCWPLKVNG